MNATDWPSRTAPESCSAKRGQRRALDLQQRQVMHPIGLQHGRAPGLQPSVGAARLHDPGAVVGVGLCARPRRRPGGQHMRVRDNQIAVSAANPVPRMPKRGLSELRWLPTTTIAGLTRSIVSGSSALRGDRECEHAGGCQQRGNAAFGAQGPATQVDAAAAQAQAHAPHRPALSLTASWRPSNALSGSEHAVEFGTRVRFVPGRQIQLGQVELVDGRIRAQADGFFLQFDRLRHGRRPATAHSAKRVHERVAGSAPVRWRAGPARARPDSSARSATRQGCSESRAPRAPASAPSGSSARPPRSCFA